MKAQAHVLDRLGQLPPRDRAWILKQLSPHERSALMGMATAYAPQPPTSAVSKPVMETAVSASAQKEHIATVRVAAPEMVADTLRREPAWLIAAVLSIEEWTWTQDVLHRLPLHLRTEVAHHADKPGVLTPALREALLEKCAQQLRTGRTFVKPSKVRVLLKTIEAMLVSKRLALRI